MKDIIEQVVSRVQDWESDMGEFFGSWNEWASHYRMIDLTKGEKRPSGVSKNITAETPSAVNALASAITRMQTFHDPHFELRSTGASEDELFEAERRYMKMLKNLQFKRNLLKGNRSMCLFGTQVWEEPYVQFPAGTATPLYEGTDFIPLSLLQVAFDVSVYDIKLSDYIATTRRLSGDALRFMAYSGNGFSRSGVWDLEKVEEGIKEMGTESGGYAQNSIEDRRQRAGYGNETKKKHELILFHGRFKDQDKNEELLKMWSKFGKTDDIRFSDITVGVLDRKRVVRMHPTPYGTWHHQHKVGHYIEFELEPIAYAVGKFGSGIQKDMNRIVRYANDVAKFSMWNLFLAGRGADLKTQNMNIFPWSVIPAGDINQVRELRPQIEGILSGLKLNEFSRDDFRRVTQATDSLQAEATGGTATETALVQKEALRGISLIAEVNDDMCIRPHYQTMHRNDIDQNPFDSNVPRELEFIPKTSTDKDFAPEHNKVLFDLLSLTTSIRNDMPLDFNVEPILKTMVRRAGIDPRELKVPRPQMDRMLSALRKINADSDLQREILGEQAGLRNEMPQSAEVPANMSVPTSPLGVVR